MFSKYASFGIIASALAPVNASREALKRIAHRVEFDYEPRPGFLYVRSRAISSRCNDNFDEFPAEEIKSAYGSFVGKPVFVNHHNDNHRRARGVIIDAKLHEDRAPDGSPDTWVEVLMEVDAVRFPKLAKAILAGHIDRTSMGTDVQFSKCSYCNNVATTPLEYCSHIPGLKGKRIYRTTASGKKEGVLIREICYGLKFFENSLLVEEPADPTAYFLGVEAGPGVVGPTATKVASRVNEDIQEQLAHINIAQAVINANAKIAGLTPISDCKSCGSKKGDHCDEGCDGVRLYRGDKTQTMKANLSSEAISDAELDDLTSLPQVDLPSRNRSHCKRCGAPLANSLEASVGLCPSCEDNGGRRQPQRQRQKLMRTMDGRTERTAMQMWGSLLRKQALPRSVHTSGFDHLKNKWDSYSGRMDEVPLGMPNTYLRRDEAGNYHVRLHQTNVVSYSPDGRYVTYRHGGWTTPTTATRMNAFGHPSHSITLSSAARSGENVPEGVNKRNVGPRVFTGISQGDWGNSIRFAGRPHVTVDTNDHTESDEHIPDDLPLVSPPGRQGRGGWYTRTGPRGPGDNPPVGSDMNRDGRPTPRRDNSYRPTPPSRPLLNYPSRVEEPRRGRPTSPVDHEETDYRAGADQIHMPMNQRGPVRDDWSGVHVSDDDLPRHDESFDDWVRRTAPKPKFDQCDNCNGRGRVGPYGSRRDCSKCKGSGYLDNEGKPYDPGQQPTSNPAGRGDVDMRSRDNPSRNYGSDPVLEDALDSSPAAERTAPPPSVPHGVHPFNDDRTGLCRDCGYPASHHPWDPSHPAGNSPYALQQHMMRDHGMPQQAIHNSRDGGDYHERNIQQHIDDHNYQDRYEEGASHTHGSQNAPYENAEGTGFEDGRNLRITPGSGSQAQRNCPQCSIEPGHHADLHAGHIWTNTACPAYRTLNGNDCTCNNQRNAMKRHAYGEMVAPRDVDTLRDEECPVCAEKDSYDGDQCQVCGFVKPPAMFMDPNLELAKQVDLRKENDPQGATSPLGDPLTPGGNQANPMDPNAVDAQGMPNEVPGSGQPGSDTVPLDPANLDANGQPLAPGQVQPGMLPMNAPGMPGGMPGQGPQGLPGWQPPQPNWTEDIGNIKAQPGQNSPVQKVGPDGQPLIDPNTGLPLTGVPSLMPGQQQQTGMPMEQPGQQTDIYGQPLGPMGPVKPGQPQVPVDPATGLPIDPVTGQPTSMEPLPPEQVEQLQQQQDLAQQANPGQVPGAGMAPDGQTINPELAEDNVVNLVCPMCGFTTAAAQPMSATEPMGQPTGDVADGAQEGDVCPNCGKALLVPEDDGAEEMFGKEHGMIPEDESEGDEPEDGGDFNGEEEPGQGAPDKDGDGIADQDEGEEPEDEESEGKKSNPFGKSSGKYDTCDSCGERLQPGQYRNTNGGEKWCKSCIKGAGLNR